jgi:hypothetical protein
VTPIQQRVLAPAETVLIAIAADVLEDPGDFGVLGRESEGSDRKETLALGVGVPSVSEDRRIDHYEPAGERNDFARAAAVFFQLRHSVDLEIVGEGEKDLWIRPRPGVDRLLVVADREYVSVIARQLVDDRVLDRIQILELVHENAVPSSPNRGADGFVPQELPGFKHKRVEVDELSLVQEFLVAGEEHPVVGPQSIAAKAVRRESGEEVAVPRRGHLQSTQDRPLIVVVGDSEARLESDVAAELPQQFGAKGVNRSALDVPSARSQLSIETGRDLSRCLVGEGEHADALRIERALLDQESNPLDQAESLARAGTGKNEDRLGESLDSLALGVGWDVRGVRGDRRGYGNDRL